MVFGYRNVAIYKLPGGVFNVPWYTTCGTDLIHWLVREYKWKEDVHRDVWIDNTIVVLTNQDQDVMSHERCLVVAIFLYSIRSDFDQVVLSKIVMPPLPTGAQYRVVPRYFPR